MDQLGIGIIGLGIWADILADQIKYSKYLKIISCFSHSEERAQQFANKYNCIPSNSLEQILISPHVDAVIICSPAHVHFEQALLCIDHNKHVFVEKPMSLFVDEAQQMTRTAENAGVVLMVGHEMRRLGSSRKIKSLLDNGELGEITMASGVFCYPSKFDKDDWRINRHTNRGGAIMQMGIHHIETLQYLLGPIEYAYGYFSHFDTPGQIDAVGMAHLVFKSGCLGTVFSSFLSPVTYQINLYGTKANLTCTVNMRHWPDSEKVDQDTLLMLCSQNSETRVDFEPQNIFKQQFDEFAECVLFNEVPETGAKQGLEALKVVEMVIANRQIKQT